MGFTFTKATKRDAKLRLALVGPAGSGKTYTALTLARTLGARVAVVDTERGSASKYADLFEFDALSLDTFAPATFVEAIQAAGRAGYDVVVIDSLSHAWSGKDGALEQVDKASARMQSRNNFAAWREVTPMHNALVDAILGAPMHVIVTMRTKTEYVVEQDGKGKAVPRKVGLAPVQRDGLEYEFDVVGEFVDQEQRLSITKTRCPALTGQVIQKPGADLGKALCDWLRGSPAVAKPTPDPKSPISEAGVDKLRAIAEAKGVSLRQEAEVYIAKHAALTALTREQATHIAGRLKAMPDKVASPDAVLSRYRDAYPATGAELRAFALALDDKLSSEGSAPVNSLIDHITDAASADGWPADWTQWTADEVRVATEVAREFAAKARKAKS